MTVASSFLFIGSSGWEGDQLSSLGLAMSLSSSSSAAATFLEDSDLSSRSESLLTTEAQVEILRPVETVGPTETGSLAQQLESVFQRDWRKGRQIHET